MSDISLSDEDAFPKAGDVDVVVEFKFGRNLVLTRNPQRVEVENTIKWQCHLLFALVVILDINQNFKKGELYIGLLLLFMWCRLWLSV